MFKKLENLKIRALEFLEAHLNLINYGNKNIWINFLLNIGKSAINVVIQHLIVSK